MASIFLQCARQKIKSDFKEIFSLLMCLPAQGRDNLNQVSPIFFLIREAVSLMRQDKEQKTITTSISSQF